MSTTIPIYLSRNEWKLVAALLKMAHDEFHEHGWNELPNELASLLSETRAREIVMEYLGDGYEPYSIMRDDFLMDYYRRVIEIAAEES